jgi:hypothetical protein
MKNLFIGLVVGACGVWMWFHTGGKISITETKVVTNQIQVVVSVTETQFVDQVNYVTITKTNEIWKTNMVEKIPSFTVISAPVTLPQKPVQQLQITQPIAQQPAPPPTTTKSPAQFKGPTSAGKVTTSGSGKIKMGVKRNMDGSIKQ